jgi:plasmid stability protein
VPVSLSIKNVPEALAARLRERAARNHRSLQGELLAILEEAASGPRVARTGAAGPAYGAPATEGEAANLLDRLLAIAGNRGIDTTRRLTREEAHDRKRLRKAGT